MFYLFDIIPRPKFCPQTLRRIVAFWRDLAAEIDQNGGNVRASLSGSTVEILPRSLRFQQPEASPEAVRAAVLHAREFWSGKAALGLSDSIGRETRLLFRAFADVYGVELNDANESFSHSALTAAELARLPALRAGIRATYQDAPPARPDEEKEIAAAYRRRYPFRLPAAA